MLLETQGHMSGRELADAVGVSLRTLHRDVDQLTAAGVPIYAERGRTGGFKLLPGWKTRLTGLTSSEAQAVFLSGAVGPAHALGMGESVQSAQLKLLSAMPETWRSEARKVQGRFHLDPVEWYRESEPVPFLLTVAEAAWGEHKLSIRYESWQRQVERVVSPLGLVLKAGAWYLVAATKGEPRTYRVSNILMAQPLEEACERPKAFDLASYWQEAVRRFERELYVGEAEVLATDIGLNRLKHQNAAVAQAIHRRKPSTASDGRHLLRIPVESIEQAAGHLLRLSPEVEVVGPKALRRAIVAQLERASSQYRVLG
ncbi:transcriptional regulator [Dyella acidisoli]|uniref:Transcriptional regulator n=2 Tax=Dyella acidisoli TaxID=1867834 RepID=A0ABQ5XUE8_9GAMM|nr:transcriptional regulator [Dyella acidisoli]